MPDILNDAPTSFAAALPDLDPIDSDDFQFHNEARQALRALNQHALEIGARPA